MPDQIGRGPCPKCPKTPQDYIDEGLERAARWHLAMASQQRQYAQDWRKDVPTSGVFEQQAIQHEFMAAAIRSLKGKQDA